MAASLSNIESLIVAQAVWEHGSSWPAVAKILTKHPLISRPKSFFTPQSCHTMYNHLMQQAGIDLTESCNAKHSPVNHKLAEKFYRARLEELRDLILAEENNFKTIVSEIEEIRSGKHIVASRVSGTPPPVEPHTKPIVSRSSIPAHKVFEESDYSGVTITSPPALEDVAAIDAISWLPGSSDNSIEIQERSTPGSTSNGPSREDDVHRDIDSMASIPEMHEAEIPLQAFDKVGEDKQVITLPYQLEENREEEEEEIGEGDGEEREEGARQKGLLGRKEEEEEDELNLAIAEQSPQVGIVQASAVSPNSDSKEPLGEGSLQAMQCPTRRRSTVLLTQPSQTQRKLRPGESPTSTKELEDEVRYPGDETQEGSPQAGRDVSPTSMDTGIARQAATSGKRKASIIDEVDPRDRKRVRDDSEPAEEDEVGASLHLPRARRRTEEQVALKRFQNVIGMLHSQISQHRNGNIFHNPIKNSEAPDYHDIVKRPMDLKTIKMKVKDGGITNSLEYQRDISLMFANAMMYNRPGSDVHSMAEDMMIESESHILAFRQTEGLVRGVHRA